MSLLIQFIGSALILAAFAAEQFGRTVTSSRPLTLAVIAVPDAQWGFLALEGTWCLVSTYGLLMTIRRPRRKGSL